MANHIYDPDRILLSWLQECDDDHAARLVVDRVQEILALIQLDVDIGHEEWVEVGGTNVSFCLEYMGLHVSEPNPDPDQADEGFEIDLTETRDEPSHRWGFVDINPGFGSDAELI